MGAGVSLLPRIVVRGRSFMALVLSPEPPVDVWLEGLDQHLANCAGFFTSRPVIANLSAMPAVGPAAAGAALDGMDARGLRLVGIEGIDPGLIAATRWKRLPILPHGRDLRGEVRPEPPAETAPAAEAAPPPRTQPASLMVEGPIRSGQSVLFEAGDVIVVGSVASGAEVIAGGSIHVYGALRGRAIAGVREAGESRIFCQRLEAELVAVDHLYRTAENWGAGLHGNAVQVRREQRSLHLYPIA